VWQSARRILLLVEIGTVALIISACSKPARVDTASESQPEPATQPEEVATPASPGMSAPEDSQPAPAIGQFNEAPPEGSAASLERKYLATTDPDARKEIVDRLRDLDNAEAVQVLGRLFQGTTDPETKVSLLGTLDEMDTEAGKLPILARAISSEQPQEVRAAAIESLTAIDQPAALHLLEGLTNDPDPQISEAAKGALQIAIDAKQGAPR
jgi:hypothetical protein